MTTLSKFRVHTNHGKFEVEARNPREAEKLVRIQLKNVVSTAITVSKVRLISSTSTG